MQWKSVARLVFNATKLVWCKSSLQCQYTYNQVDYDGKPFCPKWKLVLSTLVECQELVVCKAVHK